MSKPKRQPVMIGEDFNTLLKFIVQYRQQKQDTNARLLIEQLILAYAKQMVTGVLDENQRAIIINLTTKAEAVHKRKRVV